MKVFHETRTYKFDIPISVAKSHNMNFLAHWHTDVEMIYVCQGKIRVGINQESRILQQGELAVCSSGDIHYYDSSQMSSSILIIIFRPELIGYSGGWPENIRFVSPFIDSTLMRNYAISYDIIKEIKSTIDHLDMELRAPKNACQLFIKSDLFKLCGNMLRYLPSYAVEPEKEHRRLSSLRIMQDILHYLESNYMNEITLEDAAARVNLSIFHFSRLFKKISGITFKEYLNRVRISNAESLIKNTDMPITNIALECGFNSIRTFNRVFKSTKGSAPSNLR